MRNMLKEKQLCEHPLAKGRIAALDAIRQIAAFIVLVQHFFVIFEIDAPGLIRTHIFDAKAAVTLFFVLSGYVLALSIQGDPISLNGYFKFQVRRILRIYPMHVVATLFAFFVLVWIKSSGGLVHDLAMPVHFLQSNGWDPRQWLLQLTLVFPGMDSNFANPPVWTLMSEAKVAIVFPFLAWGILRMRPFFVCLMVMVLVLGSDWGARNLVGTVALLGQFAIGALLARIPAGLFSKLGVGGWIALVVGSLLLYSCVSLRYKMPSVWIAYYVGSVGAAGIIVSAIHCARLNRLLSKFQSFLRVDISYGLYILHFPIMLGFRKISGETTTPLSAVLLFAGTFFATVVISVVLMYLVERPAIRLGKRLTGKTPMPVP